MVELRSGSRRSAAPSVGERRMQHTSLSAVGIASSGPVGHHGPVRQPHLPALPPLALGSESLGSESVDSDPKVRITQLTQFEAKYRFGFEVYQWAVLHEF